MPPVPVRLAGMMFLLYFALGAWGVTFPTYQLTVPPAGLGFSTSQVVWVSSAFAISGLLAPLLVGLLADTLFRAERVLAVACVGCACLIAAAGWWCDSQAPGVGAAFEAAGRDPDHPAVRAAALAAFAPLFCIMLLFQFGLQLALTLTTVIALRNLPDPGLFSRTRMWGTVGWIAAGNAVAVALTAVSTQPLYLGAAAFLGLAAFSFTLPPTPPADRPRGLTQAFGLPALGLFRDRSFAVFVLVTFVAVGLNQFYAVFAHKYLTDLGRPHPERDLTLGQVCEVGCLFLIPRLDPRKRMKALMLVGLGGWVVRAAALASGSVPLILLFGVPMHGWSFAFFQVVGTTYLDRGAPPHLRASVQGVIAFVSGGAANLAGNALARATVDANRSGDTIDWQAVWLVPFAGCLLAFLVFAVVFRAPPDGKPA